MDGNRLQSALSRYETRIPPECFIADVPDWLRYFDDHVVAPSFDLIADDGGKRIWFSSFDQFVESLTSLWLKNGPASFILQYALRVVVMPYAPIRDAHRLHRSISEPDILPQSYDETIKSQLVGDLGEVQVQGVEEEDEDDVEVWNERQGAIPLYSLGVTINFTVMNYGLLWAKAEKFCTFLFIRDAFSYLLSRLTFCEQHLHCPTTLLNTLQADLQHSKLQLIFAMYLEGA
jgi:hypothetical protein